MNATSTCETRWRLLTECTNVSGQNMSSFNVDNKRIPSVGYLNVCFTIGAVQLVLNIMVLVYLILHRKTIGLSPLIKQLIAININDILTACAMMTPAVLQWLNFMLNTYACAVRQTVFLVTQISSLLTFAMIGIKRLMAVIKVKQKQPHAQETSSVVIAITMVGIWTFSLLWHGAVLYAFGHYKKPIKRCVFEVLLKEDLNTSLLLLHVPRVAAFVIVNGIYIGVIYMLKPKRRQQPRVLHSAMKQIALTSESMEDDPHDTNAGTSIDQDISMICKPDDLSSNIRIKEDLEIRSNAAAERSRKTQMRGVISVFIILLFLNVSSLPFVTMLLLRSVLGVNVHFLFVASVYLFFSVNTFLDPFVYCWRVRQIRQSITESLAKLKSKFC